MLNEPILFLATANAAASKEFYETRIGLTFVSDDPFALVFEVGGSTLRIQKVERVQEVPYTTLGWAVEDIEAVAKELGSRGVKFEMYDHFEQDDLGVWKSPSGARVAWFKDPDNNTLSLTEHSD